MSVAPPTRARWPTAPTVSVCCWGGADVISIRRAADGRVRGQVRAMTPLNLERPVQFGDIQVSLAGHVVAALGSDRTVC